MDDILAKKNRHLFLEEKDNVGNSFIANVNNIVDNLDTIDTIANDLERIDTVADNIDNVNTVAENIEDINTTVENLDKIDQFNDSLVGILESLLEQLGEDGNAWLVKLTKLGESILATTSAFNYAVTTTVNQNIEEDIVLTLPDSLKYRVGTHMLMVSWNGTVCYIGEQYTENGNFGEWSNTITINVPLQEGDKLQFRIVALADSTAFINQVDSILGNASVTATGSTESRSLANRFSDFINIKDYGAKGDGENDDTEAWNAWHTALGTKGMGYIPSGNYLINGSLKKFPMGCLGNAKDDFKEIRKPYTNRFENSIPTGQGHFIENFRELTIHNYNEGMSIAPSISLDTHIHVPENATPITSTGLASGGLIGSTHGIHIQHILTGGNSNNKLYTTCISTNAINDAVGDNDCGAISARATKTANAGIGDTGALGGRLDNYSEQRGGVMGSEFVVYNHVQGIPRPADFSWAGTSRWASPIHVVCSADNNASPITAGILINGAGNSAFDGIEITRSTFVKKPGVTFTINDPKASGITPISVTTETLDGVDGSGNHVYGYLSGTVGIDCGSWLKDYGHPEYGIVLGYCHTAHLYTPGQMFKMQSAGQTISAVGVLRNLLDSQDNGSGEHGDTEFGFSEDGTVQGYVSWNSSKYVRIVNKNLSTNDYDAVGLELVNDVFQPMPSSESISLGSNLRRFAQLYVSAGSIETSDERLKRDIDDIPEAVLRAWGKVNFSQFRFKEAYEKKGEAARIHIGVIAQRVIEAFESENVDPFRYGLLCYDEWEAKDAEYSEWDEHIDAIYEEDGTLLEPERTVHHKNLSTPAQSAGTMYSIRYEEALALECAYQRWLGEQRDAKITALMQRISALENNQ